MSEPNGPGGLMWRLKKGTAGVKPIENLIAPPPDR
jgi:hypothetical protein